MVETGKLAGDGSGAGGYVLERITGTLPWYRGIFCRKNNGIEPDGNI